MWWCGSRKAGGNGLRSRNPGSENLFWGRRLGNTRHESVSSRFDRDGLQAGEISRRIESSHIARDLDPADSISLHLTKTPREQSHQLFVLRPNALRLSVVRITCRRVAGKKLVEGADLNPCFRQGADKAREFSAARSLTPSAVRQRKKLERAIGLAGINKSRARPLELFFQIRLSFAQIRLSLLGQNPD
jgi:hypothetical protein